MSSSVQMHVRPATIADIPTLADIGYEAFFNEPIDGHWFPFKEQHPHDYHRSFIDELSLRLVTPGNVIMVVEMEQDPTAASLETSLEANTDPTKSTTAKTKVVAYLVAIRHGLSDSSLEALKEKWNPDTPLKKLTRTFLSTTGTSLPNRAISSSTISSYYAQASTIYSQHMDRESDSSSSGTSKKTKGWIDCRFLAVHPTHQGKGAGEKLIEWIAFNAAREDVPVFLDTSDIALPLYRRYGARVIGIIELPEQRFVGGDGDGHGESKKVEALEVKVLKWKREWATRELVLRARL